MAKSKSTLKVVPIRAARDESVVRACESMLRAAKRGQLTALVAVGVLPGGDVVEYFGHVGSGYWIHLAGAAACLERRVQDRLRDIEDG